MQNGRLQVLGVVTELGPRRCGRRARVVDQRAVLGIGSSRARLVPRPTGQRRTLQDRRRPRTWRHWCKCPLNDNTRLRERPSRQRPRR